MGRMMKVLLLALLLLTVACGKKEEKKIVIGVSQIIEHPALDAAREGFIKVIKESEFKDKVEFDIKSAQGDMSIAQNISAEFVSSKVDMILAIATPTAQAALNSTKDIPILITAVTDPKSAGLISDNVTGTSDATPIDKQFELIKEIVPSAKIIGIVYNLSEQNSELQVKLAKETAIKYGFRIETVGVTNVTEVSQALDALLEKVDVLYTPADNLVASSMPLIAEKTLNKKIPVIAAEKAHVESGALATEGIDYYKLGEQTGKQALEVLRGAKPNSIAITTLKNTELIINVTTAEKLNITLPKRVLDNAKKVK